MVGSCEVKNFRLVVFKNESEGVKKIVNNPVCFLQRLQIEHERFGLGNNDPIIYIRKNGALQVFGAHRKAMHHKCDI
jgi:hypothetical protein